MTKHAPLKSIFSIALFFGITSCDDESKVQTSVSTQFIQNRLSMTENSATSEVSIILSRPALQDGIITISAAAEDLNRFNTNPEIIGGQIELHIATGQREVAFSFTPVDNSLLDENESIDFKIESVSEGLTIGDAKSMSVLVIDDESPALVGFQSETSATLENSGAPTTVAISFSHAVPGTGSIEVSLGSENATYGTHYLTEPSAVNGKILLPVESGVDGVEFKVIPVNDQLFNGERKVQYTISKIDGPLVVGQATVNTLKITDDELQGKGKGYTIGGGGWGYKKEYQYNETGKISKVLFEQSSPGYQLNGHYNYEYDASGNLVKMKAFDLTETIYTWENGRIVKEEAFRDGVLQKYVLYAYDLAGNVGEAAYYYRHEGELKHSLLIVYLYKLDGNIYKQLNYSPDPAGDYNLLSTKTWESYSSQTNPFTMVEIFPNKTTQPNLPLSYRLEEGGLNILYTFTYQFNKDGRPTKRTATSSAGSETAVYEYY